MITINYRRGLALIILLTLWGGLAAEAGRDRMHRMHRARAAQTSPHSLDYHAAHPATKPAVDKTPVVEAKARPEKVRFWKLRFPASTKLGATKACTAGAIGPSDEHRCAKVAAKRDGELTVRTTAYTHTEADHIKYRRMNAIGTTLQYGSQKSAAADWSIFPLGTKFRIDGDPSVYVIDDYGSALVGGPTIDLYKPSKRSMNTWGVRHVNIQIIEWGCYEKSLNTLKPRTAYWHVRAMVKALGEIAS